MAHSTRSRASRKLSQRRRRQWFVAALSYAAALMTAAVSVHFALDAAAMVAPHTVLDCPVAGEIAHTHNVSCYDASGALVCPLEERELHTHDASCSDASGALVCTKPELKARAIARSSACRFPSW